MKHTFATWILTQIVMATMAVAYADESASVAKQSAGQDFTYSNDWEIVSAPPPPGPYRAVNLDPRIPGQEDNIQPPMMPAATAAQRAERMMDPFRNMPPPAAGQAAIPAQRPAQKVRQLPHPQHMQRNYGYGSMPGMSPFPPATYPPSASQGWGGVPGDRMEEQVPPPAAYDRLTTPPPGPFGYYGNRY